VHFGTIALDADSTLSGVEGIDWLAGLRAPAIAARIADLTAAAMNGAISLGEVYGARLQAVLPTVAEVAKLADVYVAKLAPGATRFVTDAHARGTNVLIVSGGVRQALLPMARVLGVADANVYGVSLDFGDDGAYAGYDESSPLTHQDGKTQLFRAMYASLKSPVMHVGDGMTDAVAREAIDAFTAFTGFAARDAVTARADYTVHSFDELHTLVLGDA
jgi:phosphoserine phosphatase